MIVGILKEIKSQEHRVSMTPAGVEVMRQHGHSVLVEMDAGLGSGFGNEAYAKAGAEVIATAAEIYAKAEMVMHVKEPPRRQSRGRSIFSGRHDQSHTQSSRVGPPGLSRDY